MGGGGTEGPDAGDGLDGFAGLDRERTRPADVSGWPGGRRSARIMAVADAAAIAIALTLIAATLILGRPLGGVALLLGPGVALVVVGQVLTMVVVRASRSPRTGRRFMPGVGRRRSINQDLLSRLGPVDRRVGWAVRALCIIGFLSFITGIFFTFHGGPAGSGGGCACRLQGHGIYTCVSKTTYELAGAALQRMVAGIFLSFYAMHFYAALARSKSTSPGAPFSAPS